MKVYVPYHTDAAIKGSERIMDTVTTNLRNFLTVKKRSVKEFVRWAQTQKCPGGSARTLSLWPKMSEGMEAKRRNLQHADTRAICLVALYMNKPVQDVMFSDIPIKNL